MPSLCLPAQLRGAVRLNKPLMGLSHETVPLSLALFGLALGLFGGLLFADALFLRVPIGRDDSLLDLPEEMPEALLRPSPTPAWPRPSSTGSPTARTLLLTGPLLRMSALPLSRPL